MNSIGYPDRQHNAPDAEASPPQRRLSWLHTLFAVGFWALLSACGSLDGPVSTEHDEMNTAPISIHVTQQISAGEPLAVVVESSDLADSRNVLLIAQGTSGTAPQVERFSQGFADFVLGPEYTRVAGSIHLGAIAESSETWAEVMVVPGQPIDPILTLVGPRSIEADGEDWTMLVAVPQDRFGNAVADETPVTVHTLHPGTTSEFEEQVDTVNTTTSHLLAAVMIPSRKEAGRMLISATSGTAHSREETVMAVPGEAKSFEIRAEPNRLPADGRQHIRIVSDQIHDQNGNVILDGTSTSLLVSDIRGIQRTVPAQTIDGRAYGTLQATTHPTTLTVQASIGDTLSDPIQVAFTAPQVRGGIDVFADVSEDQVSLSVGPLVGAISQLAPDGTQVRFQLKGPEDSNMEIVAETKNGYAQAVVRHSNLVSGTYQASVLTESGNGIVSFQIP